MNHDTCATVDQRTLRYGSQVIQRKELPICKLFATPSLTYPDTCSKLRAHPQGIASVMSKLFRSPDLPYYHPKLSGYSKDYFLRRHSNISPYAASPLERNGVLTALDRWLRSFSPHSRHTHYGHDPNLNGHGHGNDHVKHGHGGFVTVQNLSKASSRPHISLTHDFDRCSGTGTPSMRASCPQHGTSRPRACSSAPASGSSASCSCLNFSAVCSANSTA